MEQADKQSAGESKKEFNNLGDPVTDGGEQTLHAPEQEKFKFAVSGTAPVLTDSADSDEEAKSAAQKKEMNSLRDSYIGRLPVQQRSVTVSFAWQELWAKASRYLKR